MLHKSFQVNSEPAVMTILFASANDFFAQEIVKTKTYLRVYILFQDEDDSLSRYGAVLCYIMVHSNERKYRRASCRRNGSHNF